jgi:membrane protein implicated in regulation of membrane protease activity
MRLGGTDVVDSEFVIYVSMAVIGLLFLMLSAFGVGGDHDVGGDVGGGLGAVGHDLSASGVSPLSLPLIATFLGTSGGTGAMLHSGGLDPITTAGASAVVGVVAFIGIYYFMSNFLVASQSSSSVHEKEFEGKTGMVTETIPASGVGAIALTVRGTRTVVSARSGGERIPIGAEVSVKRVTDSVAHVEEIKQT